MRFLLLISVLMCSLTSSFSAVPKFLIITDIHYGSDNANKEGEDTGPQFLQIALGEMKKLSEQVDFILDLGDMPTHMLFSSPKKAEYEHFLFHELYQADERLKPMFYLPGNNDSLTGNYQPFEVNGQSPLNYADDWTGACVFCSDLIIDASAMRSGGYYSSYVIPDNKEIILIALNSAPFVHVPILAASYPNQEKDALAELSWLAQQLKTHKAKQLLIAMHVPPGFKYDGKELWHAEYVKQFIRILEDNYSAYGQISLLAGHTHMDELRKIALANGKNIYLYSTAAVSRIHHNNPAMKIISLNNQMAIRNYTTYYTSQLDTWADEQYQALGDDSAIFPHCPKGGLATCLDSLNKQQVCDSLEQGLFYGAKSERVIKDACTHAYEVNPKDN